MKIFNRDVAVEIPSRFSTAKSVFKVAFSISIFSGFCYTLTAQVGRTLNTSSSISLAANAYLYPSGDSTNGIILDEKGVHNWQNKQAFVKVFFLCRKKGMVDILVKLKSAKGNSRLSVGLDNALNMRPIVVQISPEFKTVHAGKFNITTTGYHSILIQATSKTGAYFPDIEAIETSGITPDSLAYNKSEYRGAASVHLRYPVPGDSAVKWFYSEVMVPKEVEKSVNAYYETNGFNSGYMGIQINSLTERRFIFSIWSLYKTDDPKQIPSDYAVNLKSKGKDVFTGEFGDEGSGGHSHLVYPWQAGKTYRLLNGIKSMAGDSTTYIAYFATPQDNYQWHLMSEWTQNKTDTKTGFRGLYSFVENFGSNGNDYFKAYYGNQWVCTPAGTWIELTDAVFSTTASPQKHQRYDYGAGVEGKLFYMYSGGFKNTNNISAKEKISRPANGVAPVINFENLLQAK